MGTGKRIRVTQTKRGKSREDFTVCKIRWIGELFYAAAGMGTGPSLDIQTVFEESLSRPETIHQRVSHLKQNVEDTFGQAYEQLGELLIPEEWRGRPVFQAVVAGTDDTASPTAYVLFIPKEKLPPDFGVVVKSLRSDSSTASAFLGQHTEIDRYTKEHNEWLTEGIIFDTLRKLIRLEVRVHPNEVGLPIGVLFLTAEGARWVQKDPTSACPDIPR